jgi:hypothetical protein
MTAMDVATIKGVVRGGEQSIQYVSSTAGDELLAQPIQ